jgi:hypothetical protein
MFDHVTIRASSRAASERFYEIVLRAIGKSRTHTDAESGSVVGGSSLGKASVRPSVSHGRGLLTSSSREVR